MSMSIHWPDTWITSCSRVSKQERSTCMKGGGGSHRPPHLQTDLPKLYMIPPRIKWTSYADSGHIAGWTITCQQTIDIHPLLDQCWSINGWVSRFFCCVQFSSGVQPRMMQRSETADGWTDGNPVSPIMWYHFVGGGSRRSASRSATVTRNPATVTQNRLFDSTNKVNLLLLYYFCNTDAESLFSLSSRRVFSTLF